MSILANLCGYNGTNGKSTDKGLIFTKEYLVVCDDTSVTTVNQVIAFVRSQWSHYPGKITLDGMVCIGVGVSQDSSGKKWTVSVEYQSRGFSPGSFEATPLDEPWSVSWDRRGVTKPFSHAYGPKWLKDASSIPTPAATRNTAVLNSFKEVFDPPIEQEEGQLTLVLSKNISTSKWQSICDSGIYDSVNPNSVTIVGTSIPAYCGRVQYTGVLESWLPKPEEPLNRSFFIKLSATVLITPDTWVYYILDQGFKAYATGTSTVIRATEPGMEDQKCDQPSKLDGYGYFLRDYQDPIYLGYHGFPAKSWSVLDLPDSYNGVG